MLMLAHVWPFLATLPSTDAIPHDTPSTLASLAPFLQSLFKAETSH